VRGFFKALLPTFRYWMQTEVHVFAFSAAANLLLSFFPFLIVMMSLLRLVFNEQTTIASVDTALRDFFPQSFTAFLYTPGQHENLPVIHKSTQLFSIVLLLFTANGIFEPLEVALNHVWGVRVNRSFFRNQLVSLALIFTCGGLALLSMLLTGIHHTTTAWMNGFGDWIPVLFFKFAAMMVTVIMLFLVYYFLPNFRPPRNGAIASAIVIGILMEGLKYASKLVWPSFMIKLENEYGVFKYSVTLVFLGFFASMLFLAGAEWSARGHRADLKENAHV